MLPINGSTPMLHHLVAPLTVSVSKCEEMDCGAEPHLSKLLRGQSCVRQVPWLEVQSQQVFARAKWGELQSRLQQLQDENVCMVKLNFVSFSVQSNLCLSGSFAHRIGRLGEFELHHRLHLLWLHKWSSWGWASWDELLLSSFLTT